MLLFLKNNLFFIDFFSSFIESVENLIKLSFILATCTAKSGTLVTLLMVLTLGVVLIVLLKRMIFKTVIKINLVIKT